MKIGSLIFAGVLFLVFGIGLMGTQAGAEEMNFTLVSMVEKIETVAVTYTDGVVIGVMDRKGLSRFDNGDIATTACRGTFDAKKGFQGYSSLAFDDGSTLVLSWTGPTSRTPAGGKFGGYSGAFEYANGTGRFEGIQGSGSFTAKVPQWDKDFQSKGFTYYEFSGTYSLPYQ
ncbi:MAG: hypothetical protein PVG78_12730 [Desulfobacterales bacterium]|jgi:hypothetical protein